MLNSYVRLLNFDEINNKQNKYYENKKGNNNKTS